MKKALSIFSVAASLALSAAAAHATNLVANGGFESTTLLHSAEISSTNLSNWNSVSVGGTNTYSVLYLPGEATTLGATGTDDGAKNFKMWAATESPTGGNFVAIDADPSYNSALQQSISGLVVGQTYNLGFSFAGAQATTRTGPTTERWQVSLGNDTQTTSTLSNASQGFTGWVTSEMSFVATSSTELLSFLAVGTPAGLPPVSLLDNLTLTAAVPEPSTYAMMLLGMGVVAGIATRKRRAAASAASAATAAAVAAAI